MNLKTTRWLFINMDKIYLQDRLQYMKITHNSNNSIQKNIVVIKQILFGAPQGSISGPLLFICYMYMILQMK